MKYKLLATLSATFLMVILLSQFTGPTSANTDELARVAPMPSVNLRHPLLPVQWLTVVNNSVTVPGSSETFASYGQPSVNTQGVVAFRGRSTGSSQRQTGIFKRVDLASPVEKVADLNTLVPYPNNLDAKFIEFPSVPRISPNTQNIATRGNHKPVYNYVLPSGEETRVGTNGLYVQLNSDLLITGASKLGAVPGFEYFRVPGFDPAIPFSVFPGSPSINDMGTIVFKGNYSIDDTEKTGIFHRSLLNTPGGGNHEVEMIASSDTTIPNPPNGNRVKFGSTAPPSIVGDDVVFVGLDNEAAPHRGGIYIASIAGARPESGRPLRAIASIGVDGPRMTTYSLIGESLSFDGRYVAYWAGQSGMKTIRLNCPTDGNPDLLAYCNGEDPDSIFDPVTETWYQLKQVPVNQGIYVYDRVADQTFLISSSATDFDDYLFWVYSGKVPGIGGGEEDAEPPRWRASAFVSVWNGTVTFKARTADLDPTGTYNNIVDGIYFKAAPGALLETVIETSMDGSLIDPMLEPGEMQISALGIEREALRGSFLAMTVTMENAEAGWGGIYMANVTANRPKAARSTRK